MYLQMLISQYFVFCTFQTLLNFVKVTKMAELGNGIRILCSPVHVFYGMIFTFCFLDQFGAYCDDNQIYPWIFIAGDLLFLVVYFIFLGLYLKGFGFEWAAEKHEDITMSEENIKKWTKEVKMQILFK